MLLSPDVAGVAVLAITTTAAKTLATVRCQIMRGLDSGADRVRPQAPRRAARDEVFARGQLHRQAARGVISHCRELIQFVVRGESAQRR